MEEKSQEKTIQTQREFEDRLKLRKMLQALTGIQGVKPATRCVQSAVDHLWWLIARELSDKSDADRISVLRAFVEDAVELATCDIEF